MDNTILSVRDFTVRSLLPLSRIRNTSPEAREIRMIASSTTTTILNITGPLMFLFSCLVGASISCLTVPGPGIFIRLGVLTR